MSILSENGLEPFHTMIFLEPFHAIYEMVITHSNNLKH